MKPFLSRLLWSMVLVMLGQLNSNISFAMNNRSELNAADVKSMPIMFTENKGQWSEEILYKASLGDVIFYFEKNHVAYCCGRYENGKRVTDISLIANFINSNLDVNITGDKMIRAKANFFYGSDRSKWHTNVSNYSSIAYKDIYPGIDLIYSASDGNLKYNFIIQAGIDYSQIQIQYEGSKKIEIAESGDLAVTTSLGKVYEKKPLIFQILNGEKRQISGSFKKIGLDSFGFELGDEYDPNYPVIIDPPLGYSSYLGGGYKDCGLAIAVRGNYAFITGYTYSGDFPNRSAFDNQYNAQEDAFIAKFDLGYIGDQSLIYCSWLGGNANEAGKGIAVDEDYSAYIAGYTFSGEATFPIENAIEGYDTYRGNELEDAFVAKIAPAGDDILYCTYLGGDLEDIAEDIAVDNSGNAYVTGLTKSTNIFPAELPGFDNTFNQGTYDAFVAKLSFQSPTLSLIYGTYLGGNLLDQGSGIAVDDSGYAYITGATDSYLEPPNGYPYPTTPGAYEEVHNGWEMDPFVTKLSIDGTSLIYSTFLGDNRSDYGNDIAIDAENNSWCAYVVGKYLSPPSQYDAFVVKLNSTGSDIDYYNFLGGDQRDLGLGIAVNTNGEAYITGYTESSESSFNPVNAYDASYNGNRDAFVAKYNSDGDLIYSTYFGGQYQDEAWGVGVGSYGYAFITGYTQTTESNSPPFPLVNAFDDTYNMVTTVGDAFIARFGCYYIPGDANHSGSVNGLDVNYMSAYFRDGPPPPYQCDCPPHALIYAEADANGNCDFNGLDVTYMVAFLKGGPPLQSCDDCEPGQ